MQGLGQVWGLLELEQVPHVWVWKQVWVQELLQAVCISAAVLGALPQAHAPDAGHSDSTVIIQLHGGFLGGWFGVQQCKSRQAGALGAVWGGWRCMAGACCWDQRVMSSCPPKH